MRTLRLRLLVALGLGPGALVAQEGGLEQDQSLNRADRVVLYSPHYDTPLPRWGGLSCPSGPLHLYGFEGDEADGAPSVLVRVFAFDPTRLRDYVFPAEGPELEVLTPVQAQVQLTHVIGPQEEVELRPRPGWAAVADEEGLVRLSISPGVYRIRVEWGWVEENEGVIQVREARSDSIHAYVMPGAIC